MKKTILAVIAIAFLGTAPAFAQTMMGSGEMGPGMMTERQQQGTNAPDQEYLRHMQTRMMNSYGMMGGGYNMMDNYGMGPCSVGESYNMKGNYGMMPMMGGPGMMHHLGLDNYKKYGTFAKESRDLRKKLHDLMFDYGEARWNPDTTVGELNKMAEEMKQLRQDIQKKIPQ